MNTRHPHQGEPHLLHSLTEWRALFEMAFLPYSVPGLMLAPRGDGHPVLLLPGFMADEVTLFALKFFLRSRGYDVEIEELAGGVQVVAVIGPYAHGYLRSEAGTLAGRVGAPRWTVGGGLRIGVRRRT